MTTNELYDYIIAHESIILTVKPEDYRLIKRRITKKRQRENRKLGEFADKSKQLQFTILTEAKTEVRVRISIVDRSQENNILDCIPAAEF